VIRKYNDIQNASPFLGFIFLRRYKGFLVQIPFFMASLWFVIAYSYGSIPFLSLEKYIAGTEAFPFQYRVLCAWLARPIVIYFENSQSVSDILSRRPSPFNDAAHVIFMGFHLLCMMVLLNLIRYHLKLLNVSKNLQYILPFGFVYILPFTTINYPQSNYWLPYDLPSIVFFYSLVVAASTKKYLVFFLLFPVALLNRETAVFAGFVVFLQLCLAKEYTKALAVGVVSISIFFAIKYFLVLFFDAQQGGTLAINQLALNARYLSNPMWWPSILGIFGFLWLPVLLRFCEIKDEMLRASLYTFPIYFLLMLFVGQIVELRIFSEYAPLFYVSFAAILARHIRSPEPSRRDSFVQE
jgi:hypothetical protein